MRDLLITALVFGTLPYILRNAYLGVLVWSWLSYMNPHRLAWGFAATMPFAQIVALVLFASLFFNREKKVLPRNNLVIVWALFLVWLAISTALAIYPEYAADQLINVLKIQLVTFVTMLLMKDFNRINQLIWVIVFSIGYYSVKGGVFTLMTGGAYHVYGPDGSYIMENNSLAVAILMIVPLMVYMNKFPPHRYVKLIMPYCIFLSLVSVIGSQSRGALLAIGAVGAFFWIKSKSKVLTGIVFIFLAIFGFLFMPQSWHDRMASIGDYENDSSAMERLYAWEYSIAVANDRVTGGGFNSWTLENYHRYGVPAKQAFVAHSIYFSVLNDGGWPGLILFVLILLMVWRQLGSVIKRTDNNPKLAAYSFLARMLQISMVAFMSGGIFLSLSYFDLAWHLMAITIALNQLANEVSGEKMSGGRERKSPLRRRTYTGRRRLVRR